MQERKKSVESKAVAMDESNDEPVSLALKPEAYSKVVIKMKISPAEKKAALEQLYKKASLYDYPLLRTEIPEAEDKDLNIREQKNIEIKKKNAEIKKHNTEIQKKFPDLKKVQEEYQRQFSELIIAIQSCCEIELEISQQKLKDFESKQNASESKQNTQALRRQQVDLEDKILAWHRIVDAFATFSDYFFSHQTNSEAGNVYFNNIKEQFEEIWLAFTKQTRAVDQIHHGLAVLIDRIFVCGPGIFAKVEEGYNVLFSEISMPHWWAEFRMAIINKISIDHILGNSIDIGNETHVRNVYLKLAEQFQFNPTSAVGEINEFYAHLAEVDKEDELRFKENFMEQFTLENFAKFLCSHFEKEWLKECEQRGFILDSEGWMPCNEIGLLLLKKLGLILKEVTKINFFKFDDEYKRMKFNATLFKQHFLQYCKKNNYGVSEKVWRDYKLNDQNAICYADRSLAWIEEKKYEVITLLDDLPEQEQIDYIVFSLLNFGTHDAFKQMTLRGRISQPYLRNEKFWLQLVKTLHEKNGLLDNLDFVRDVLRVSPDRFSAMLCQMGSDATKKLLDAINADYHLLNVKDYLHASMLEAFRLVGQKNAVLGQQLKQYAENITKNRKAFIADMKSLGLHSASEGVDLESKAIAESKATADNIRVSDLVTLSRSPKYTKMATQHKDIFKAYLRYLYPWQAIHLHKNASNAISLFRLADDFAEGKVELIICDGDEFKLRQQFPDFQPSARHCIWAYQLGNQSLLDYFFVVLQNPHGAVNNGQLSLLYAATLCNQVENVKVQLQEDEDIDRENLNRSLCAAVLLGSRELVQLYIERGADVDFCEDDESPISMAMERNPETLDILINADAKIHNQGLLVKSIESHSPLSTVKKLLQAGINVNEVFDPKSDDDTRTALHVAVKAGSLLLVDELLKAGANVNQIGMQEFESGTDIFTPLHVAARHQKWNVMYKLLTAGADVDILCNGLSPFEVTHYPQPQEKILLLQIQSLNKKFPSSQELAWLKNIVEKGLPFSLDQAPPVFAKKPFSDLLKRALRLITFIELSESQQVDYFVYSLKHYGIMDAFRLLITEGIADYSYPKSMGLWETMIKKLGLEFLMTHPEWIKDILARKVLVFRKILSLLSPTEAGKLLESINADYIIFNSQHILHVPLKTILSSSGYKDYVSDREKKVEDFFQFLYSDEQKGTERKAMSAMPVLRCNDLIAAAEKADAKHQCLYDAFLKENYPKLALKNSESKTSDSIRILKQAHEDKSMNSNLLDLVRNGEINEFISEMKGVDDLNKIFVDIDSIGISIVSLAYRLGHQSFLDNVYAEIEKMKGDSLEVRGAPLVYWAVLCNQENKILKLLHEAKKILMEADDYEEGDELIIGHDKGDNLLMAAVNLGNPHIVRQLIPHVVINAIPVYAENKAPSDKHSRVTALCGAAVDGSLNVVKELLAAGAAVEGAIGGYATPLQYAVIANNMDIANELIQAGANLYAEFQGKKIIDLATTFEMKAFIQRAIKAKEQPVMSLGLGLFAPSSSEEKKAHGTKRKREDDENDTARNVAPRLR